MFSMIARTMLILLCIGTGSSSFLQLQHRSVHQAINIQSARFSPDITRSSVQVMTHSVPDCEIEVDTSITANNDNTEVKGLLLVPDLPDVCYVRDISQAELQSVSTCDPGLVSARFLREVSNQRRYFAGEEISANQLPENLRDQCEGRRIISLIEVPTTSGDSSEKHKRRGSAKTCLEITVLTPRQNCPRKQGRWWLKR